MTATLLELGAKLALFLLERWILGNKNKEEMLKLYNSFLKEISKHSELAVKKSIQIEDLLLKKQQELKKELENKSQ